MTDVDTATLTQFQWDVLKMTMTIPYGETRSYAWVAKQIGRPKAVRAVGQALRRNPFLVVIPCHRVICSNGTLGAYAGEYGDRKRELLIKEGAITS